MVPAPESNSRKFSFIFIRIEQELRRSEGTHVPEPRMVTVISTGSKVISFRLFFQFVFIIHLKSLLLSLWSTTFLSSASGISARAILLWPPAEPTAPKLWWATFPASLRSPSFLKIRISFLLYIPETMLQSTVLTFIKKSATRTQTSGFTTAPRWANILFFSNTLIGNGNFKIF